MTELSPQAQAVLDHFLADAEISMGHGLAAALRAAALCCRRDTLILLSLADELEGQS